MKCETKLEKLLQKNGLEIIEKLWLSSFDKNSGFCKKRTSWFVLEKREHYFYFKKL